MSSDAFVACLCSLFDDLRRYTNKTGRDFSRRCCKHVAHRLWEFVLGGSLQSVVSDEKQRCRGCQRYDRRAKAFVDPMPATVSKKTALRLKPSLQCVYREECEVGAGTSTSTALELAISHRDRGKINIRSMRSQRKYYPLCR